MRTVREYFLEKGFTELQLETLIKPIIKQIDEIRSENRNGYCDVCLCQLSDGEKQANWDLGWYKLFRYL